MVNVFLMPETKRNGALGLDQALLQATAEPGNDMVAGDFLRSLVRELISIDEVAYEVDLVCGLEVDGEGWYHFAVSTSNARQAHFLARGIEQHRLKTLDQELYQLRPVRLLTWPEERLRYGTLPLPPWRSLERWKMTR